MICFTFAESAPSANTVCPKASKAAWTSGASSRRFCIISRVVGGYIDSDMGPSGSALVGTSLTPFADSFGRDRPIAVRPPLLPRRDACGPAHQLEGKRRSLPPALNHVAWSNPVALSAEPIVWATPPLVIELPLGALAYRTFLHEQPGAAMTK